MEWHRLTKKTMPPEETPILLWIDYNNYGFPATAVHFGEGVIMWKSSSGLHDLNRSEWRNTRWSLIEPPEGAVI